MAEPEPAVNCPTEITAQRSGSRRHWSICWILIVCAVATITGRVLTVGQHGARGDSPFFSANDRSRWCTIRSLGDRGEFEIDEVIDNREQPIDWDTIDKVRHVGRDGAFHYYSSKPTLLPTMLAGLYRMINIVTGMDLEQNPRQTARIILLLINALPWLLYLWLLAKLTEHVAVGDWTRWFVVACAGFGTFLSTFAVTLNNHWPAAISVMIAVYGLAVICRQGNVGWLYYALTGLFAAFAAANELPALAFLALAGLIALGHSVAKTCLAFLPAALLVVAGFFLTNYLAFNDWRPPYAHRGDGAILATAAGDFEAELNAGQLSTGIRDAVASQIQLQAPQVTVSQWPDSQPGIQRWTVRDLASTAQFTVVKQQQASEFEIRAWNNWYDYPDSYWLSSNTRRSLVDCGQASQWLYAFHILVGHHGILSLTPIWLLSMAGTLVLMFSGRWQMRWLGWMAFTLTTVVIVFYIGRPALDRNYGGWTSGLRWLFWLAPIWLVCMLPIVDWLARTVGGRVICLLLLAASALSAMYSWLNPWVHPWLYEIWDLTGWPK